jgi:intracellular sulfur oxidation DsrE/DsrF family protein
MARRRSTTQLTRAIDDFDQRAIEESVMTKYGRLLWAATAAATVCVVAAWALVGPLVGAEGKGNELASAPTESVAKKQHRLVLQVNTDDPAVMNLALNNATNVEQYYKGTGEKAEIEIVTFGPGLHMLREDTSPVKDRIKAISEKTSSISFKACGNTQENMGKAENKQIALVAQATVVKSGVVRVMELQEQGWAYVRP